MLSKKARYAIFGLALETIFESGDALEIMQSIQKDKCDFDLAVLAFRNRWQKVLNILIELGAWISNEETYELIPMFLKGHDIHNEEIWREVVLTDHTIHMWSHYAKENVLQYFDEMTLEEKKELDRIALIRAIISSLMIETRVNQEIIMRKRPQYTFKAELKLAAKKMASFHIRTSPEELKALIKLEFPQLPDMNLEDVDKIFETILSKYIPVEIELKEIQEEKLQTATQEISNQPLAPTEDEVDDLFDSIQLPPMETKNPITQEVCDGQDVEFRLKSVVHEVSPVGIVSMLRELIPDFSEEEIQERAMEELRNVKRHSRTLDKMEVFWEILKLAEKLLLREYDKNDNTSEMKKIGKLYAALSMYKIEIGNDQKIIGSVKYVVKIQG